MGNPFSLGPIHPGETVLDFGCGAGADLCIAGLLVGPTGRVIGFDLTPAMVQKARANAERTGLANVTVYEADIAQVPLQDASADVVISNGAINLLPDKACALREGFRAARAMVFQPASAGSETGSIRPSQTNLSLTTAIP